MRVETQTSRARVRELKRAIACRSDTGAMVALLEHSVRLGHKKLALRRFLQAERMGIAVRPEVQRYCEQVLARLPAESVGRLLQQEAPETA